MSDKNGVFFHFFLNYFLLGSLPFVNAEIKNLKKMKKWLIYFYVLLSVSLQLAYPIVLGFPPNLSQWKDIKVFENIKNTLWFFLFYETSRKDLQAPREAFSPPERT